MDRIARCVSAAVLVGWLVAALVAWDKTQTPVWTESAEAHTQPTPTPTPTTTVTIDSPRNGSRTRKRFAVVEVSTSTAPKGTERLLRIQANRWMSNFVGHRGKVPLRLGRNRIVAHSEVLRVNAETGEYTVIDRARSKAVTVKRIHASDYGRLDRATAQMATVNSRATGTFTLCGISEDCYTREWCFAVSHHRVDCPVGLFDYRRKTGRCALVATVRVRERRVYVGRYPCFGRIHPNPRRHVRRDVYRKEQRYRTDQLTAATRTPLGLPRFDYRRDLFIP